MSRLYDRILEGGCRPATQADFLSITNVLAPLRSLAEQAASQNATNEELGLDESFTGDSLREFQQRRMAVARTVVSDWHLNLGALEDAVVVAGDDVGAYLFETWRASGALDLSTVLGRIAPPFEQLWVEFRSPNRHGLY